MTSIRLLFTQLFAAVLFVAAAGLLCYPSVIAQTFDDNPTGSSVENERDTDWSERDNVPGRGGSSFEEDYPVEPFPPDDNATVSRDYYDIDRNQQIYIEDPQDGVRGQYAGPDRIQPDLDDGK